MLRSFTCVRVARIFRLRRFATPSQERGEGLLLGRTDVEELAPRPRRLEKAVVLTVARDDRIVEDDDPRRVSAIPEHLVVLLDRLADVSEAVRRDDED